MAPTETLEIEMSPRESHTHTPTPFCSPCPEIERLLRVEELVKNQDVILRGNGTDPGIVAKVSSHDSWIKGINKVLIVVTTAGIITTCGLVYSAVSFSQSAKMIIAADSGTKTQPK